MTRLPARRRPERMGLRTSPQVRCPAHLAWIRGHECAVNGDDCEGRIEAAHVRGGTDGGLGKKPGDNFVLPLCSYHHRMQHVVGEAEFERVFAINMKAIAEGLWRASPARKRMEAKETTP